MCNAIFHPAQREMEMINGFYGKRKRSEVWVCGFNTRGSESLIFIKLEPSIRKPSVSLKSLEWRTKLIIRIVAAPVFVDIVGFLLAGS